MTTLIIFAANYLYLVIIAIALIAVFASEKTVRASIFRLTAIALPLAFLIGKIFNYIYYNPRPFVVEHIQPLIPHAANNGFPSDHTLLTMTIAGIVFIYHKRLGLILAILALTIGISRVLAKVHHPIDILGSIVIAVISVFLSWYILKRVKVIV